VERFGRSGERFIAVEREHELQLRRLKLGEWASSN
jgi:hypothetical protein